jgi:DNA repair ATPase RecN
VDPKNATELAQAAERYVEAALAAGLEAIAITEHNSVAFLDALQTAATDKLIVFPGIEVSAADGYHLLCLFDPGTTSDDVQALLHKLGFERGKERWDDNAVRTAEKPWDLSKIVEEVDKRGGICIGPHVRREKGLLDKALANDIRVNNWRCTGLLAVEDDRVDLTPGKFEDDCLRNHLDNYKRERPFARVWGSDAKSYDAIGTSQTLIKMVEPSVEGLRQAFLDPGSRIRHPDRQDLANRDRITRVTWDGGFLNETDLGLAQQLTCLIGGKGTGKSTVVESLRFALGAEHSAGSEKANFEKLIESTLPPGTKVTVEVIRRDGSHYVITRTPSYPPEVRDAEGTIISLPPADLLDIDIYSQGQILETARRPMAHLALLDSFIEVDLAQLARSEADLLGSLKDNRDRLVRAIEAVEKQAENSAAARRLEEARKVFDKKGVGERTELRRELEREERLAQEAKERLKQLRRDTANDTAFDDPPKLLTEDLPHKALWEELGQQWEHLRKVATAFRDDAVKRLDAMQATLEQQSAPDSAWSVSLREKRDDVARVYRELQEEFPDLDLSLFERIDRDLEALRQQASNPRDLEEERKGLGKERQRLLSELQEVRRRRFRLRDDLATRLTEVLAGAVRIGVAFQAGREDLVEALASFKTGVRGEVLRAIAEHPDCTPQALGAALLAGTEDVEKQFEVTSAQATALVDRIQTGDKLRLQELALPDTVEIEFNLAEQRDTPRYRDLARLSVGQKATSILLILLAQEGRPLVIDQPEDDLDNRFIFKDVVERLRSVKDQRQLILATHNANIPVLGDAELIVVLDAEEVGGKPVGRMQDCGSIDSPSIKRAVTQILEGGREAFRRRQAKYGIPE